MPLYHCRLSSGRCMSPFVYVPSRDIDGASCVGLHLGFVVFLILQVRFSGCKV